MRLGNRITSELLRAPLDALADGMRALLARHAANETDSIKRALASLAADLGAAQEQDIRRLREALAHAKRQAEDHLDTVRRSAQTRVLDARDARESRDDQRRDSNTIRRLNA